MVRQNLVVLRSFADRNSRSLRPSTGGILCHVGVLKTVPITAVQGPRTEEKVAETLSRSAKNPRSIGSGNLREMRVLQETTRVACKCRIVQAEGCSRSTWFLIPSTGKETGKSSSTTVYQGFVMFASYGEKAGISASEECDQQMNEEFKEQAYSDGIKLAQKCGITLKKGVCTDVSDAPEVIFTRTPEPAAQSGPASTSFPNTAQECVCKAQWEEHMKNFRQLKEEWMKEIQTKVQREHEELQNRLLKSVQKKIDSRVEAHVCNAEQEIAGLCVELINLTVKMNNLPVAVASEIAFEENNEPKTVDQVAQEYTSKLIGRADITDWRMATGIVMADLFTFHEMATSVVTPRGASMSEKNKNLLDNSRVQVVRKFVKLLCAEKRMPVPKSSDVTVKMSSFLTTKRGQKRKLEKDSTSADAGETTGSDDLSNTSS
ncbi:hypothetical protein BV898_12086 [Hypsibius exemplaris]|uniref:BEN domain-containing protein n=1 Tax=Hypsibius exemplaris TaxID=2072580 RepID=A0A1W0WET4_HYPEX|nr:hypothetical protein BV898_12086 [Hypsibius exemplaris]